MQGRCCVDPPATTIKEAGLAALVAPTSEAAQSARRISSVAGSAASLELVTTC